MSIVVVDVDNQYMDGELDHSYQIILENDNTYTVYISYDVLSGRYYGKKIKTFEEAWNCLNECMREEEYFENA